ncbi:MAG TPA: hypothetical protein VGB82_15570 [Alphaproteobacteria bacterium]
MIESAVRIRSVVLSVVLVLGLTAGAGAQGIEVAPPIVDGGTTVPSLPDLLRAAEAGDASAQYELGVLYANGDGVPTEYELARRWFGEAVRNGDGAARRQLAFMDEMGLGAPAAAGAAASDGPFRVQVASVSEEADGPREWRRLQRLHPDVLAALRVSLVAFDAPDGARLFRVEGGPLDEDGARSVCTKLRTAGAGCRVIRP